MFFDECQVDPLRPLFLFRRRPCTIIPAPRVASLFSCQYLIGTRLHWRGLPPPFIISSQFQAHSSWHSYRGWQSKQLHTLVSSPEFHLAVPLISHTTSHPHSATFEPTLIHKRILKTNRPPIHLDSTVLLCSFCSIANAGLASSSSSSSLYY